MGKHNHKKRMRSKKLFAFVPVISDIWIAAFPTSLTLPCSNEHGSDIISTGIPLLFITHADMDTTIIDATTSNSFFYYFSSTPQVLSGILALFAVLITFKIQSLKDALLVMTSSIVNLLEINLNYSHNEEVKKQREGLLIDLKRAIDNKNIGLIKYYVNNKIDKINDDNVLVNDFVILFNKEWKFHQRLLVWTLNLSAFTALVIISCLTIITFASSILPKPNLLNSLFALIVLCSGICIIGLMIILGAALNYHRPSKRKKSNFKQS